MSYDIISNNLKSIILALGYQESLGSNVDNIPAEELGNTFILTPISGQNDEDTSETLADRVYDIELWQLFVAVPKSSQNHIANSDDINRRREALIKAIDKPANWQGSARIQKFLNWKIEERKDLFLLTIEIKIIDTVIY